jgi:uncharacterized protein
MSDSTTPHEIAPHETKLNSLATAASAYLRSAMHQPVEWQEWGEAAFAQAAREDKPILLDIGAVWCHWCHVMDRESYEDPETARVINDLFVAVKVDRDERPDVDARYQAAVSSISGQGGWPLTAFLTPNGHPFFGGTYFPPDDRHGRPSLRRVLLTMAEAFEKRRDEVNDSAASVLQAIEHNESFNGRASLGARASLKDHASNPGAELHHKLLTTCIKQFDPRNGGFGSQPKFPHSAAVDLLLDAASRTSAEPDANEAARLAAMVTLEKMSKGGIYDHLAGGFHRYSVDDHWLVPHFEKMAYDNSELLRNYVHAYQSFVAPECARIARDILRWIDEWLSDRALGGFYASQDADDSLDDDGDYFTWTRAEALAVLTPQEFAVAGPWFDIGELGDMHHNPQKNVLHINHTLDQIAKQAGVTAAEVREILAESKRKLYAARKLRRTPFVDKTVYTAWNGMMISAYLEAARVLDLPDTRAFALKSLDRLLAQAWDAETGLGHVVAYGGTSGLTTRVPGTLDDYVFAAHAALDAWESTGELRYYTAAASIAAHAIAHFYDHPSTHSSGETHPNAHPDGEAHPTEAASATPNPGGAFFDTPAPAPGEVRLGALTTRRKPLQDSPTPAANSVAAALLLRLEALNGNPEYRAKAQATLETFAGVVEHFGLYAASYGLALQRLLQPAVQVCIFGEDAVARALEAAALARYAVNKSVLRLRRDQLATLPPALAATLPHLPIFRTSESEATENSEAPTSFAIVCANNTCHPPTHDPDTLIATLNATLNVAL